LVAAAPHIQLGTQNSDLKAVRKPKKKVTGEAYRPTNLSAMEGDPKPKKNEEKTISKIASLRWRGP
jgi:hypothetical protein